MITGEKFNFQYCPKIVIFNEQDEVLLCERKGEQDFDGVYSFPWGKRERSDASIEIGITREIQEELGNDIHLEVYRLLTLEEEYVKKVGDTMILPHYLALHRWGKVMINPEEYARSQWISLETIDRIHTIPTVKKVVETFLKLKQTEFFKDTFDGNHFRIWA